MCGSEWLDSVILDLSFNQTRASSRTLGMRKSSKQPVKTERHKPKSPLDPYGELLIRVVSFIEQARIAGARSVNVVLTSIYWLVGQWMIEHEQSGQSALPTGQHC
jgi:hypothetical protein